MTDFLAPIKGGFVLISECDIGILEYKWAPVKRSDNTGGYYAAAYVDGRTQYMHRLIMQPGEGLEVDHINGDGLDNTRQNLRIATRSQNCANRKDYKPKSGFRGVYQQPHGKSWQVKLSVNGTMVRGGNFRDPVAAAHKYDELARSHYGEFATLNFPEGANKQ